MQKIITYIVDCVHNSDYSYQQVYYKQYTDMKINLSLGFENKYTNNKIGVTYSPKNNLFTFKQW